MVGTGVISVSMRELDRLKVVQAITEGNLRPGLGAERLGVTDRQVRRLVVRYRQHGAEGLVSRKRGRPSNHRLPEPVVQRVAALIRDCYPDFGPTLAQEKLAEFHNLCLSKESIRRIMIDAGLWVPRQQRPAKVYQPRRRRACQGELIQIDGCEHPWFEDRAPPCTLLVYVDDATSRLMQLHFVPSESAFSYYAATRAYLEQHGKPIAFYSDKASVFRVNKQDATSGDGHTQFGRALFELNILIICANSSQAKGRVERTHLTLQDRLVKELRLRAINSMDAANAYAQEFICEYNGRFAKPPKNEFNAHRLVRPDEDLDLIFTWREPRRVSKNLTIQYDKVLYLIADTPEHRKLAGRYIEVYHYPDDRIELRANGVTLPYAIYDTLSQIDQGAIVDNKRLGHVLQMAQFVQEKRDDRRSQSVPSTNTTERKRAKPPGKKARLALDSTDIIAAVARLQATEQAALAAAVR